MLVRDGRITTAQLDQALVHQARVGGRVGSILVELGALDAETLTVYLGLELGMPIATGPTLERCKRSAVRLLTAQQAARCRSVPIVIQGQSLIIAIDDPHDMESLDALHSITGYRILPRVAPEIRIHYYLERFYGIPRPNRYRELGEVPRGNSAVGSHTGGLPGPPLPGLPPRRTTPVAAPTPRPVVRRSEPMPIAHMADAPSASAPAPAPPARHPMPPPTPRPVPAFRAPVPVAEEALELDANDLLIELEADDAEVADQAPVGEAGAPRERHRAPRTTAPSYAPLPLEGALAAMARIDQRGAVADAILGYASGLFEVAALCLVRDHLALGWKGYGPGLDADRLETLLIPLEMPSLFQVAVKSREVFRGHAFPATLHDHVFKVLRCHAPLYSVATSIAIGDRVVNLLYGHKADGSDLEERELDGLRRVVAAASATYVRLISASKAQQKPNGKASG